MLHITDPDSMRENKDDEKDPWEDDVLSDPYKHVFGHDVQDAIEQMAAPEDSRRDRDDDEGEE